MSRQLLLVVFTCFKKSIIAPVRPQTDQSPRPEQNTVLDSPHRHHHKGSCSSAGWGGSAQTPGLSGPVRVSRPADASWCPSGAAVNLDAELPSTKDLDPWRCRKKTSRMIKDPETTTCCGPSDSLHHAGTLTFLYILVLYWQNTYLFYYNKKPSQYIFKVNYSIIFYIVFLFYFIHIL